MHHPSESVFRAAPLLGRIVLTGTSPVVLTRAQTQLGAEATGDTVSLQTELLLRYLRAYAPTTWSAFAQWAGITTADAKCRWNYINDLLAPVDGGFVLTEDLDELLHGSRAQGVRLLPAKDAWLQARDRDVLFADRAHRSAVYPTIGGPGVVLVDGAPVGIWRAAAKGRRLAVRWRPFTAGVEVDIEPEAQRVAVARGLAEAIGVACDEGSTARA